MSSNHRRSYLGKFWTQAEFKSIN